MRWMLPANPKPEETDAASALEHDLTVFTADRHFLEIGEVSVELLP